MEHPLISVCINAYNAQDTVVRTVQSVLAQTYTHLEVIVIDDASVDDTAALLHAIDDERLHVYTLPENGHISNANNEALRRAKGTYIAHVDADDVWVADKLERQLAFLQAHPQYGACFSLAHMADADGVIFEDTRYRAENPAPEDRFYQLLTKGNYINHSTLLAKKSVMDQVGEHDVALLYFHDYDYWLRMATVCDYYILPDKLVTCHLLDSGNSHMSPDKYQAHINEFAYIAERRIMECPDDFFLRAFRDELRLQGPHTAAQTALEKAFVLMNKIIYLPGNCALAQRRLATLMQDDELRRCAAQDFGFTVRDFYALLQQAAYHNESEIARLQQAYHDTKQHADNLQAALDALSASHAEAMRQLNDLASSPWRRFTAPLRMLGTARWIQRTVRAPKLKDGTAASCIAVMYGYFGKNLGDDLFFDMLLKRYPDTVFAVYDANGYEAFFNRYPNAYLYTRSDPRVQKIDAYGAKLRMPEAFESLLLSKSDIVVHIGGSIYQQVGTWEEDLRMRRKRYKRRHPFFSVSSNFGPHHTDDYRQYWERRFAVCRDICFRDSYSASLFPKTKAVRTAPDLLFSLPLERVPRKQHQLFLSVMNLSYPGSPFSDEQQTRYQQWIIDIAVRHLENGHSVCLSSFCSFQGDEGFVRAVFEAIPEELRERAECLFYSGDGNFAPMLTAIAESEYMLATRFHAMLFGFSAGVRTLPICYNQKQRHVLEDMAFEGATIDITSPSFPSPDEVFALLKAQPFPDVSRQKTDAVLQFARLDEAIAKRGGHINRHYSI